MGKKITIEIVSLLLIILFVYAAVSKLLDYSNFKIQLGKSPLLTSFAPIVAVAIPTIEILIAILLAGKKTRLLGLYGSLFLLTLFTSYLIVILNFSYYIPCSCGGILQGLGWKAHIIFNLAFIVLTISAIILQNEIKNQFRDREEYRYI